MYKRTIKIIATFNAEVRETTEYIKEKKLASYENGLLVEIF